MDQTRAKTSQEAKTHQPTELRTTDLHSDLSMATDLHSDLQRCSSFMNKSNETSSKQTKGTAAKQTKALNTRSCKREI